MASSPLSRPEITTNFVPPTAQSILIRSLRVFYHNIAIAGLLSRKVRRARKGLLPYQLRFHNGVSHLNTTRRIRQDGTTMKIYKVHYSERMNSFGNKFY